MFLLICLKNTIIYKRNYKSFNCSHPSQIIFLCTLRNFFFFILASFHQKYNFHVDRRKFALCLPNAALVCGVHSGSNLAFISFGKVFGVREWSDNTNYARRVNRASDFRQSVLRTHRTAPYLCIVQKEQLVMGEIKTRQRFFFAMHRNPLLVSSEALFQAPIIGDVLSYCSGRVMA